MRIGPILALVGWLGIAAAAPAAGRTVPGHTDPLNDALLHAERTAVVLGDAARNSDSGDYLRARKALNGLEEALAMTPYRGSVRQLRRELQRVTEGKAGRIPPGEARRLQQQVRRLAAELRGLMMLRLRYPPGEWEEEPGVEGQAWRDRLVEIMEEEALIPGQEERPSMAAAALRKVLGWLDAALGWVFQLAPGGGAAPVALQILLSLILLGVAGFMGRMLLLMVRRRKEREAREEPAAEPLPRPRESWSRALEAAAEGRWSEAFRRAYLYLVGTLESAGMTVLGSGRTNGELLEDVGRRGGTPGMVSSLAEANQLFERVRYGGERPDQALWRDFRRAVEATDPSSSGERSE